MGMNFKTLISDKTGTSINSAKILNRMFLFKYIFSNYSISTAEILKMFSFASNLLIIMKDTPALGVRVMVFNATFNNISAIS
jgi:hypothetical protein